MVDTVALTIREKDFKIFEHDRFSPCTKNLYVPPYITVTGRAPFKAVNNPTKEDIRKNGYMPRLTLMKALRRGGFTTFLKVEFSVPKLLHGNNFDEVCESDFGEISWKIVDILRDMGVLIRDVEIIAHADVSSIHYSKNIILTDFSEPYTYLKEISKLNINRILDTNQTDFRNEGHSVKYRSNDFEVIFYDKLKDLRRAKISERRAIEKDNVVQLNLFDHVKTIKPFEVLRFEVRIGSRRKLKQLLKKAGFVRYGMTFEELFSKSLSKKILLDVLEEMEGKCPKILKTQKEGFDELFVQLRLNNPSLKFNKLLAILGAKAMLEETGVRTFRKRADSCGKTCWYRLNRAMKELILGEERDVFGVLLDAVRRFETLRLEKYRNNM
jgi:hypothetical protein